METPPRSETIPIRIKKPEQDDRRMLFLLTFDERLEALLEAARRKAEKRGAK